MILYSIFIPNISTCINMISKTRLWILAFSFVYVSYASSHDKCFILNSKNYLLGFMPHVSFAAWMFTRLRYHFMTYFKVFSMYNFNILLSSKSTKISTTKSDIFWAYHVSKYSTISNMFALVRQSLCKNEKIDCRH